MSDNTQKIVTLREGTKYLGDTLLALGYAGAISDVHKVLHFLYEGTLDPMTALQHDLVAIIVGRIYRR